MQEYEIKAKVLKTEYKKQMESSVPPVVSDSEAAPKNSKRKEIQKRKVQTANHHPTL